MISFRTVVDPPKGPFAISHSSSVMLVGSCFAENIGFALDSLKFKIDLNPFGVIYNPVSISRSLKRLMEGRDFKKDELFYYNERWNSFMHHSRFSASDENECIKNINNRVRLSSDFLKKADTLIITFGTAWVFYLAENGMPVSNCHKLPSSKFNRKLLEVDAIVEEYKELIKLLKEYNEKLKIIFTVSPVRHLKDGADGNQLSKSVLLVAVHKLCNQENISYFPSYEIVMDDLRDYRFYSTDMVHPSDQAIDYVFEKFSNSWFSEETRQLNAEIFKIKTALNHRPTNISSDSYRKFVDQVIQSINYVQEKYPIIDFSEEKQKLINRIA